jgi:site-specific recombinase XerD
MASGGIFERPPRSGTWWIDYRGNDNRRHREKIGSRAEAAKAYSRRLIEISEGKFLSPRSARALTFRELAKAALEAKRIRLAPLSYETDCGRLEILLPQIGAAPAAELPPALLEAVFGRMRNEGLSGSTVNRYRSLISSIYSFGVRTGLVSANPVARVKRFRENESRVRYLKKDEETALRAAIRSQCPDREPELDLALYTGMRRGEQFTLKWADVDLDRGILTVKGKTGQRHVVANSGARAALERLKGYPAESYAGTGYIFREAMADSKRDNRRWFENAVKKAGLENFHWHDLRHTFASRLVMAGADIRTVQELMGHKSILMTMRYAHLSPDHRAAAAEKIGGNT